MQKKTLFQNDIIKYAIVVGIIIYGFVCVRQLGIPCIMDDELGYWGNAAYLCGYDWLDVMSNMNSYSYGYSLILAVFLKILPTSEIAYQSAVFLNYLMLAATFILLSKISSRVLNNVRDSVCIFICLAAVAYPSYQGYVNVTLVETLLLFLCTLITYMFMKIVERPTLPGCLLFTVISMYMYMVHQRCIVIVILSFLFVIFRIICTKNKNKMIVYLPALLIVAGILFFLHTNLNGFFEKAIIFEETVSQGNTYVSELNKVKSLFSIDGILNLMRAAIGQFYYMMVSTAFLLLIGIWGWFKDLYGFIKGVVKDKKIYITKELLLKTYVFMILAGGYAVSVLSCSSLDRLDQYFYGRYFEYLMVVPMIYGFEFLIRIRDKVKKEECAVLFGFSVVLCSLVNYIFNVYAVANTEYFVSTNVIAIDRFFDGRYDLYQHVVKALVVFIVLLWAFDKNKRKSRRIKEFVCLGLLFIFFTNNSRDFVLGIFKNNENSLQWNRLINEAYTDESNVYYLKTVNSRANRGRFQFLLRDVKLECIGLDELETLPENSKVIVKASDQKEFETYGKDCLKMMEINNMQVWAYKLDSVHHMDWHPVELEMCETDIRDINQDDTFVSDGRAGYLIYGQDIGLEAGSYQIVFDLQMMEPYEGTFGWCEIKNNGKTIRMTELTSDNIKENNNVILEIDSSFDTMNQMEFCIYFKGGIIGTINEVKYKKTSNSVLVGENNTKSIQKLVNELEEKNVTENIYFLKSNTNTEYDLSVIKMAYPKGKVLSAEKVEDDINYVIVSMNAIDIFDVASEFEAIWMDGEYVLLARKSLKTVDEYDFESNLENSINMEFFRVLDNGRYSNMNKTYSVPSGLYVLEIEYTTGDTIYNDVLFEIFDGVSTRQINLSSNGEGTIKTWIYSENDAIIVDMELLSHSTALASIDNIRIAKMGEVDVSQWSSYPFEEFELKDYICMVYRYLLGREPDPSGLEGWSEFAVDGERKTIFEHIQASEEHLSRINSKQ